MTPTELRLLHKLTGSHEVAPKGLFNCEKREDFCRETISARWRCTCGELSDWMTFTVRELASRPLAFYEEEPRWP